MDGIEVVVDRDAADAHHFANRFDRLAEQKRAALVEHANGGLFLFAGQFWERRTELLLDRRNHLLERIVQVTEAGLDPTFSESACTAVAP